MRQGQNALGNLSLSIYRLRRATIAHAIVARIYLLLRRNQQGGTIMSINKNTMKLRCSTLKQYTHTSPSIALSDNVGVSIAKVQPTAIKALYVGLRRECVNKTII